MPENRNPSSKQYDPDTILSRAFHALTEEGWDVKQISDRVGMDENEVQQRLSSSGSSRTGRGGTSGTGGTSGRGGTSNR
jgi:hypothetical protein